uniref:Uncharacterized protein n=1 Tax=Athene cunicularia TaxID=194338 RepID=A0A663MME8_ATHCN
YLLPVLKLAGGMGRGELLTFEERSKYSGRHSIAPREPQGMGAAQGCCPAQAGMWARGIMGLFWLIPGCPSGSFPSLIWLMLKRTWAIKMTQPAGIFFSSSLMWLC